MNSGVVRRGKSNITAVPTTETICAVFKCTLYEIFLIQNQEVYAVVLLKFSTLHVMFHQLTSRYRRFQELTYNILKYSTHTHIGLYIMSVLPKGRYFTASAGT